MSKVEDMAGCRKKLENKSSKTLLRLMLLHCTKSNDAFVSKTEKNASIRNAARNMGNFESTVLWLPMTFTQRHNINNNQNLYIN